VVKVGAIVRWVKDLHAQRVRWLLSFNGLSLVLGIVGILLWMVVMILGVYGVGYVFLWATVGTWGILLIDAMATTIYDLVKTGAR
jgi:hypothetical protein